MSGCWRGSSLARGWMWVGVAAALTAESIRSGGRTGPTAVHCTRVRCSNAACVHAA
jgi:hypothetical protein